MNLGLVPDLMSASVCSSDSTENLIMAFVRKIRLSFVLGEWISLSLNNVDATMTLGVVFLSQTDVCTCRAT